MHPLIAQDGQRTTAQRLIEGLGLSEEAREAVAKQFPRPELLDETFQFDRSEFEKHATYRSVELDTGGALLIAEDARFEEVFRQDVVDADDRRVRYTTEGRVVDQKLRKTK